MPPSGFSSPQSRSKSAPGLWASLLLPDFSLALTTVSLLYSLVAFVGMQFLFRDSDAGWHIRNGENILALLQVPQVDPYSFSKPGGQWFAWEWLADVFMGAAHQWDGLRGVYNLYAAVLGLTLWLWFRLHWLCESWFLVVALMLWVTLVSTSIHWLARPHIFGWIFLLMTILLAEQPAAKQGVFWLFLVGLVAILWTNMHGSFFLGPAIFGLYAGEAYLRKDSTYRTLALWSFLAALLSFANPYGWQVHRHIFHYLQNKELLSRVGEYQTFNFSLEGAAPVAITVFLAALGSLLNFQQGKYARALLCCGLFFGSLRTARGLPIASLVAVPFATGAICQWLGTLPLEKRWASFRDAFVRYNLNLRKIDRQFTGYLLAPILLVVLIGVTHLDSLSRAIGFAYDSYPVAISSAVEKLPADARLYSSDKFGGYLIYRFAGQRKVFFDGRSDYYGADFLKNYTLIPTAQPGWEAQWAKWNFSHALVAKDQALSLWLPRLGWQKIAEDSVAILFAKGTDSR